LELFSLEEKAAQLPGGLFVSAQVDPKLTQSHYCFDVIFDEVRELARCICVSQDADVISM